MQPAQCMLFSGAAQGAEAAFGAAAERHGLEEVHFTFEGHNATRTRGMRVLTQAELQQGDVSLAYVSRLMHRTFRDTPLFRKVLQCIWHQVNHGQEIYVVGQILEDGTVKGGTGWGAEFAKLCNKPLFVFAQDQAHWFHWTGEAWEEDAAPRITHPQFTGTGTRFLQESGLRAINALFARSFRSRGQARGVGVGSRARVKPGLHNDARKNGHSLSECCHGVVFGLCQLRGHRSGCSRLRQQHFAYTYRYRMGSWPTARIRRALGRIIPPQTARIICESMSIQGLWPLGQESLCNPKKRTPQLCGDLRRSAHAACHDLLQAAVIGCALSEASAAHDINHAVHRGEQPSHPGPCQALSSAFVPYDGSHAYRYGPRLQEVDLR